MFISGELKKENLVIAAGIGCHGKMPDFLNFNSFIGLHGRSIPMLVGAKIANPNLKVVGFVGDGDAYAEGLDHLLHAAKKNIDMTVIVHNNQIFALTTGQHTPTSPKGYKTRSAPHGNPEEPFNPLSLLFSAGATFIARSYALDVKKTQEIIAAAMRHKGFSFVEIAQPCITFYDTRAVLKDKMYWVENNTADDYESANSYILDTTKLPLGVFYQVNKSIFE